MKLVEAEDALHSSQVQRQRLQQDLQAVQAQQREAAEGSQRAQQQLAELERLLQVGCGQREGRQLPIWGAAVSVGGKGSPSYPMQGC